MILNLLYVRSYEEERRESTEKGYNAETHEKAWNALSKHDVEISNDN